MKKNNINKERVEKRNKLFNEVKFLENEEAKIRANLAAKRKALKDICMCDERECMYEYSICVHCKEHH